jgi:hypothetical protein
MAPTTRVDRRALAMILRRQIDVIARDQALAVGLTRNALRHRLRSGGQWLTMLPGVYVAATGTPTMVQQQMAAMLYAGQDSVITGPAALRYHRIRGTSREFVDVLIPATRKRRDLAFVRVHRTSRMPGLISRLGPLRYALPARAVADAARDLTDLRDVRAIVADAVQRHRCTTQELCAELTEGPTVGSKLFREALSDVAEGIRSAAEGDLKDLLRASNLPMPLFNPRIYDGSTFIAQPDAWWPEYGIAVEVDSHEWHMSPHDHTRTVERQTRMGQHGILVLPFTPRQIRTEPVKVIAAIRAALGHTRKPAPSLRTEPRAA